MDTLTAEKPQTAAVANQILTYVLLDIMDASAPIYQTLPGGKREQIKKIPFHRPFLQVTFTDVDGKNRTLRYKGNTDKIYQDEQIKDGILANEQFTQTERADPYFRHGYLTTKKPTLQKFLAAHPENVLFQGICDDVPHPTFRLLDKVQDAKLNNQDLKRRAKAATKILDLDLEAAQEMLIRLNGSYFVTPDEVDECQNLLIAFLDDTNEAGVESILKEDSSLNIDETTTVLIGKLINKGILSFDKVEGKISKKLRDGKWVEVRDMSATYSMDEKKRLFSDFLNSSDGRALKSDLEADLNQKVPELKSTNKAKN